MDNIVYDSILDRVPCPMGRVHHILSTRYCKSATIYHWLRRSGSRVIGDSFSEFRHIESRKSKLCIALLAHDKDVCVVRELSVLCITHVYVLVHLWPCRCASASRKVKSRVI
jgi:hypothetical protein